MGITISPFALLSRVSTWLSRQDFSAGLRITESNGSSLGFGDDSSSPNSCVFSYNISDLRLFASDDFVENNKVVVFDCANNSMAISNNGAPTGDGYINASGYQVGGTEIQGATSWVLFDGTGTPAITDDLNIASITDLATGHYTVVIDNDLSNANYAVTANAANSATSETSGDYNCQAYPHDLTTGSFKLWTTGTTNQAALDPETVCAVTHGGI